VSDSRIAAALTRERDPSGAATTVGEHIVSITHARTNLVATAIACAVAPVLLLLGAATAHAVSGIGADGTVGIGNPNDLPAARTFNPQPDPPAFTHPGSREGLGGPDTLPSAHH
jgi:hypothetical protein